MLGVTSGSELFWNRRNRSVRNGNIMWICTQLPFNENRMKISIKKSALDLPCNCPKLSKYQFSSLKNKKPSPKLWTLPCALKLKTEVRNSLKNPIYSGNLHHLTLRMLKELLAIVDFNWQFFLLRQPQRSTFSISWYPLPTSPPSSTPYIFF